MNLRKLHRDFFIVATPLSEANLISNFSSNSSGVALCNCDSSNRVPSFGGRSGGIGNWSCETLQQFRGKISPVKISDLGSAWDA